MRSAWVTMATGLALTLIVAVPTLVVEEDWRGRPMIDQPGHLWVVPTVLVGAAFALGGGIASRGARELWRALSRGLVTGTASAGVLLGADVLRRAMRHEALSAGVARLWIEAAVLSIAISSLGGAASCLRASRKR